MRNGYGRRRTGGGYWGSLVKLIAHLIGTAIMFGAILLVAWGLSYFVHKLNAAHPFPEAIYSFVTTIEIWLVYIDVGISAFVFMFGAVRFLKEIWEDG